MELHEDEARPTPRSVLGHRLKRLRETSGLSLRALADALGYPHTYIGRVERGEQLPSKALAEAMDVYFRTDELFAELLEMAQESPIPDYGRTIVANERKARRIQVFTSSLIPGLLQTEEYARALFRASLAGASGDQIDALVKVRMDRKRVFAREEPPYFWAIMDESALKRPVGGPACMAKQLAHVLNSPYGPHMTVQVLPFGQGAHPMMGGSMSLLTLTSGATIGYVESFDSGEIAESPRRVLVLTQTFDVARSMALPEEDSLDLLRAYLREYEDEVDS
jgi:transcriptional regulator with XRE-family HTH domain